MNWDHFFLLGWYKEDGTPVRSLISTEAGLVDVVITGSSEENLPMWDSPVPPGCNLREMPAWRKPGEKDIDKKMTFQERMDHAKRVGGIFAFGWVMKGDPIVRVKPK